MQKQKTLAAIALTISLSTPLLAQPPAKANPFKGLFSGILRQVKGTGLGIINTAVSNPVGTFRLLNERVFKIQGTEKYLQYYDKYGKYLRYVPGVGGQTIPASLVIDVASKNAGLKNGLPTDLNSILDEILGPQKTKTANSTGGYNSNQTYTDLLQQIQREASIASTGPLGIPDPTILNAAIDSSVQRGLAPDPLLSNPVASSVFAKNQASRNVATALASSTLSEQGQQNIQDTILAIDTGLEGVTETAKQGIESTTTQDVAKALVSLSAQTAGFHAISAINGEIEKLDRAVLLTQLINSSQTQDSIRRQRDAELNSNANRLIYRSRRRVRF